MFIFEVHDSAFTVFSAVLGELEINNFGDENRRRYMAEMIVRRIIRDCGKKETNEEASTVIPGGSAGAGGRMRSDPFPTPDIGYDDTYNDPYGTALPR